MSKNYKQYIPFLVFVLMLLFAWVEEAFFMEGRLHEYFYSEKHYLLRAINRGFYVLFLFAMGYIGLKYLKAAWPKQVWIVFNVVVLLVGGIRLLPLLLFNYILPQNLWNFLASFYSWSFTPFPYLFLWLMAILFSNKKLNNTQ